jgi:hypothetical protein
MSKASAAGKYAWQAFFTFNLHDDAILGHLKFLHKSHVGAGGILQIKIDIEAGRSIESMKNLLKGNDYLAELRHRDQEKPLGGRIYVMGHGDWAMATIGGYDAAFVAETLRTALAGTRVNVVSVLGCDLARDKSGQGLVNVSFDSFGAALHRALKGFCDIVYARVFLVNVNADGLKRTGPDKEHLLHHRDASKMRFYWNGASQMRDYVSYNDAKFDEGAASRATELTDVELERAFGSM